MLAWRKRLAEWRAVIRFEHGAGRPVPYGRMVRSILSGVVDRKTWRRRMKICYRCPVYDRDRHACRAPHPAFHATHGCGCYVPFVALTSEPYENYRSGIVGCWGYAWSDGRIGWPGEVMFGFWDKAKRLWHFIVDRY